MPERSDPLKTRPSLFGRIQSPDSGAREIAWRDFFYRYAPIIRGFARSMGAQPQDCEDIVQDVLTGFFGASRTFVYDPAKGRFRGYLKRSTINAIRARARKLTIPVVALEALGTDESGSQGPRTQAVDEAWDAEWERQALSSAIEQVCQEYGGNKTFRAFQQYVILGLPASEVARSLGLSVDSVYQAKVRVTESLRKTVERFETQEP